ncbi:MAG TPA: type IVB secretion system protein IcmH/DotU [Vicinamibacterales bacterium]|jgi:type VI secretion system protein ImpK|nr:type IVB secretion system protein IcmH/DotU [Vicinamibacterales bacterium]
MPDTDDPFLPSDLTHRPRPGAGRRGTSDTGVIRPVAAARVADVEPISDAVRASIGLGLNPLVQAAIPLLLLAGQLRGASSSPMDVGGLRRHVLEEIRRFEDQARAAGVRNEIVLAARYALCAALDEAVLSTPWGAQSEWAQHPVLVALHREAWGGEKFFEMLNRISADPARHLDLLELQHLILSLGFTGKYQMLERGHEQLADLQREISRTIHKFRGAAPAELSLKWRGLEDQRSRLIRYVPWWVVVAAAVAVLAVTFVVYQSRLATQADPLQAKLAQVGLEDFSVPPPPAPVKGPTLKQLLAPEEAAGHLTVEENGGRTLVTLRGGELFGSGSADVNPEYEPTLERIGQAINQVPGRVMIVGHTDDQPIKSLKFPNNYELSRERAVSVANVLKKTVTNPARLTWSGAGSSQPRYRPESDPENRARNRRVEIIHLRGE